MLFKVFVVVQIGIQFFTAQISARDLASQNILNDLINTPLTGHGRSRRQINNPPVGLPENGNVPVNGLGKSLQFRDGLAVRSLPRNNGLNFALNNGLPNNSPISSLNFPFPNTNTMPQNRLLPNINGINKNGLPNGLPSYNNVPNSLPGLNNVPNGLPKLNNDPNGLPGVNIVPNGLPDLNNFPNALSGFNIAPNGLPGYNNVPNGFPGVNIVPNGLPGYNNVPNGFPGMNIVPNGLPGYNNVPNGLPGLNNVPNVLPGFNNVPNSLPGFNAVPNGLPGLNNVANGLPGFINVPNGLPGLNNVPNGLAYFNNVVNGLSGINQVPNELPVLNDVPNRLANFNNQPVSNKFQTFVPAGNNNLNLNNLSARNPISSTTSLPSFNNLPCGNALPSLPVSNGLLLNNLPNGNMLSEISNRSPFSNNFRITQIGAGHEVANINRYPRNNEDSNVPANVNNFQDGNRMTQKENYKTNKVFSDITITPASASTDIVLADDRFTSVNHLPISNIVASEAQNMQQNNGWPDVSNLQNYNEPYTMQVNELKFVNDVPSNNDFVVANNFPVNTVIPINANSRLVNNGMSVSNRGYLNDISFANNVMAVDLPEIDVLNSDNNGFSRRNLEFGNIQVPDSKWHYEFVGANMPGMQNLLSEGVQMFSNMPNDYQPSLVSNNLSLAQELVKKLQIEGLANMPFLNGLPVAGITETVTVLNEP